MKYQIAIELSPFSRTLKADDFIPAEVEDLQVGVEGEVCVVDLLHVVVGEI